MLRPGLNHFVVISLVLHAAILFVPGNKPPAQHWLAGPVIVRLMPEPESIRESRPARLEKAATASRTKQASAMQAATAVEKIPQRHRPARIPAALPAAAENPPDTNASPGLAQSQERQAETRSTGLEQQLLDNLHEALLPHFNYPLLARRRGWEGIVRVGIRVESNGELTRVHLVEPSPYTVLNTAAINSLMRLARLPNAGTWLQGRHVDLVIPVEYRLLEG